LDEKQHYLLTYSTFFHW